MSINGAAMLMRIQLARLMVAHKHNPVACSVPLSTDVDDGPMILSGYASTTDIDLERTKFRGWAFVLPYEVKTLPLLYKHDPKVVAGQITSLEYDDHGAVRITAKVDHPIARRMNAFSVMARVLDYELRETADKQSFHALVTRAELSEFSLTDVPANPKALVKTRLPVPAASIFYELMQQKVACLQRIVTMMQREIKA